jgi:hypothetical protein
VAAATEAMAAKGPASAVHPKPGPTEQVELSEGELTALRALLEGAVLCNDSQLTVAQDEASGEAGRSSLLLNLDVVCEAACLACVSSMPQTTSMQRKARVFSHSSKLRPAVHVCLCVSPCRQDTVQAAGCPH